MTHVAWSYSSLKTFQQCPRKYYHTKVAKDFPEPQTQAMLYGEQVHKAAEDFIKSGTPIPEKFEFIREVVEQLASLPGEKHCELRLGLTKDLKACGFFDKNVWWRGIADLVIVNEEKGLIHSIDYKTGKSARYADVQQLDLVAAGLFAKFPNITKIKSALLFVVSKEFVKATHQADMVEQYVSKPAQDVARIEAALENGVWNPVESTLCKFCPVKTCEYNRS
jgi:hypothetical protein